MSGVLLELGQMIFGKKEVLKNVDNNLADSINNIKLTERSNATKRHAKKKVSL